MSDKVEPIYSDKRVKKHQNLLILIASGIIVLILGGWLVIKHVQNAGRPSKSQYPVLGMMIDQSDGYQDFQTLDKHGIRFIYFKATEGASYTDDNLESNYSRVQGSQIPFGFYHNVSFDSSAASQFKHITSTLVMEKGTLPFVLKVTAYGKYADSGLPTKKVKKIVKELSEDIKNYYGDDCIVQLDSSSNSLSSNFNRIWSISNQEPEGQWVMWQYNDSSKIPGFASSEEYHLSVLNGGEDMLNGLIQSQ